MKMLAVLLGMFVIFFGAWRMTADTANKTAAPATPKANEGTKMTEQTALATFGAGCFWCVEAIFQEVDGVISAESGYMGGHVDNPTYKQVCTGSTGHAEVIQVAYDPAKVSYEHLLNVFWKTHDPTTLNRQGADVGTQYRSAVFYHSDEQKAAAEKVKKELNALDQYRGGIVTEISPVSKFYVAEDYHQDYYQNNSNARYCQFVIKGKLEKYRKMFK